MEFQPVESLERKVAIVWAKYRRLSAWLVGFFIKKWKISL